jgi:hypothetical protein
VTLFYRAAITGMSRRSPFVLINPLLPDALIVTPVSICLITLTFRNAHRDMRRYPKVRACYRQINSPTRSRWCAHSFARQSFPDTEILTFFIPE